MATLTQIKAYPATISVHIGEQIQCTAIGIYDDNTESNITSLVTWHSSNASIATVNTNGKANGISLGSTNIYCTYNSNTSNNIAITVTAAVISLWQILPYNPVVSAGSTLQLTVNKVYSDGSIVAASVSGYVSKNTGVATVSFSGLITGVSSGGTMILISALDDSSNTVSLSTDITVQPIVTATDPNEYTNYCINGQFAVTNDYFQITANSSFSSFNPHIVDTASATNPFYINGSASDTTGNNVLPNTGKILFYKYGAYTGADKISLGKMSTAGGGTNFEGDPIYFIRHNCTTDTHDSNTRRFYEFPQGNVTMFNSETITVSILAKKVLSGSNTVGSVRIHYRLNYGDTGYDYYTLDDNMIALTSTYSKISKTINIPAIDYSKIGKNNFFSIIIELVNENESANTFLIYFTNVQVNRSSNILPYQRRSLEEVSSIIKTEQLPIASNLNNLVNNGDVLTIERSNYKMNSYVNYTNASLVYNPSVPAGTTFAYPSLITLPSGPGWSKIMHPKGHLYLFGNTVSRTRYPRLYNFYYNAGSSMPFWGYGDGCVADHDPLATSSAVRITNVNTGDNLFTTTFTNLSGFTVNIYPGTDPVQQSIRCVSGLNIYNSYISSTGPGYITLCTHNMTWYILFVIDGIIRMPTDNVFDLDNDNLVLVNISIASSSADVANALLSACNPISFKLLDFRGAFLRGCDLGASVDPDVSTRTESPYGITGGSGSLQNSAMTTHTHGHTLSVSVDLTTADVKTKAASGSMLGPSIDYNTSTNFDYHENLLGITSAPTVTSSLTIANAGTSTESRPPNIYVNWIQKY